MQGVLLHLPQHAAQGIVKSKGRAVEAPASVTVSKGDLVIGIDRGDDSGSWFVTLVAFVWQVPKGTTVCRLKAPRYIAKRDAWHLPYGLPTDPATFADRRGEPVAAGLLRACLTDMAPLGLAASRLPLKLKAAAFQAIAPAMDGIVVTLHAGKPEVWVRDAYQEAVAAQPDVYKRVLQAFLERLPAQRKGYEFEKVLEELFVAMGWSPDCVTRTRPTADGGRDLELKRRDELTGDELYLVQAKNLSGQVPPEQVRAFRDVCRTRRALKGIVVAPGGFSVGARAEATQRPEGPHLELIDASALTDLVWRHLSRMPDTRNSLLQWVNNLSEAQPSLALGAR